MRNLMLGARRVVASDVLRSYWFVAAERQSVYFKRLAAEKGPWSNDPVLSQYRFTNAFRAADRVSQDLIRIQYSGPQSSEDLVFRTLLYRFFNKPATWSYLQSKFGELHWREFNLEAYDHVLSSRIDSGTAIYSAAYIVPPPPFGALRKHRNHLLLIEHMMLSGIANLIQDTTTLQDVFRTISSYPSLGPFLAFQLTIDLNYSALIDFDENDFVVAGPGARSGIAKCFPDLGGAQPEDVIRWMVDSQDDEFEHYGIEFQDLFGRPLALIDCQNLFCETDKYARVAHPTAKGVGSRTRIKQQFSPLPEPQKTPFFPPKWGINDYAAHLLTNKNPALDLVAR